ncbi:MAG: hypothetical protein C4318_07395 [Acidimicrobiia bacterium]
MSEPQVSVDDIGAALAQMIHGVSEPVLDWLVCNAPVIFALVDPDGIFRMVRGRALNDINVRPEAIVGTHVSDFFSAKTDVAQHLSKCMAGERSCFQTGICGRVFEFCCEPIKDDSGAVVAVAAVGTDITDRVKATEALAAEEELLKATIEAVGDAVIATDSSMKIVLFNEAAQRLTGWDKQSAIGRQLGEVVVFETNEGSSGEIDVTTLASSSIEREISIDVGTCLRLRRKDGSTTEVAAHYAPIKAGEGRVFGAVLSMRDTTEERRRDEERIRLEKLESLALMASGISHDFNNMLAAILANLGLAKEKAAYGSVLEFLEEAETAALQARELTNRLASFARPAPHEPKAVDLKSVISQAVAFALAGKNIEHVVHISDDLWPVLGDENQLVQAFNNLLLNAEQAMPGGGCITVRAENLVVTEGDPTAGPYLGGGRFVKVIVEDQGVGIPPENLEKVFDPYFTTKPAGTGLGLSTTFSIVRRHGGHMSISSTLGQGTVALVYLPAADIEVVRVGKGEQKVAASIADASERSLRVLVMDDEAGVRKVAKLALEEAGWDVEVAEDAIHAIEKFREALEQRKPYDVVVLDSVMRTGLDGSATLAELRKLDREVKAIAFSGYVDDTIAEDFKKKGFSDVVAKPFNLAQLRLAVARAAGGK